MKYILYNHIGSANHGCEALVRTISEILGSKNIILLSEEIHEEEKYGICNIIDVQPAIMKHNNLLEFIDAYFKLKLKGDYFPLDILPYKKSIRHLKNTDGVLVSIGGDIYCYDNYPKYILLHKYAKKYIKKSILLGCSIEPELLFDKRLIRDLETYDLISARESITYNALIEVGLKNVVYCPDSAFILKPEKISLPDKFIANYTVGLNISPLVINKAKNGKLLLENYCRVIEYIINHTMYQIALIPHVSWEHNNDLIPLNELYKRYKSTERVCILPDLSAPQVKYCISRCRYFIGARTHATIAAYSTGVPTLVLGYSVKSKGIARDIFGTEENYVIDYRNIKDDMAIVNAFCWIETHDEYIRSILFNKNIEIKEQLKSIKDYISNIM